MVSFRGLFVQKETPKTSRTLDYWTWESYTTNRIGAGSQMAGSLPAITHSVGKRVTAGLGKQWRLLAFVVFILLLIVRNLPRDVERRIDDLNAQRSSCDEKRLKRAGRLTNWARRRSTVRMGAV